MPLLPLALRFKGGETVRAHGLIDSGATVSVMPYGLGIRLGAVWEAQTTVVKLTGNLADQEARALLAEGNIGNLTPVRLVFAWARSDNVPLFLGQVNFFEEFNVSLRRAQRVFEIERATK